MSEYVGFNPPEPCVCCSNNYQYRNRLCFDCWIAGQDERAYEREQEGREAHKIRLLALGLDQVANIASNLRKEFQLFERSLEALPRNGWLQLDKIKLLIESLN